MTTSAENERLNALADEVAAILSPYAANITQGAAPGSQPPATLPQRVAWMFNFYLSPSVNTFANNEGITLATNGNGDKRAKTWGYVVRFWSHESGDAELVGESDPETMTGTGKLPAIVEAIGMQMHEHLPQELTSAAVKERLPQIRNNLGRSGSAVLRVNYETNGVKYLCQVDIHRLDS